MLWCTLYQYFYHLQKFAALQTMRVIETNMFTRLCTRVNMKLLRISCFPVFKYVTVHLFRKYLSFKNGCIFKEAIRVINLLTVPA